MAATACPTQPEQWEYLAWQVFDRLEALRRSQRKAAAAVAAETALKSIEAPQTEARKEPNQ
jgi:hypothetical protein